MQESSTSVQKSPTPVQKTKEITKKLRSKPDRAYRIKDLKNKEFKMKKILCAVLAAIMLMTMLVSCGDDSEIEIPENMQLVKESKEDGFIFFGPSGWQIANQGDIASTFISSFNKTSITFAKAKMPVLLTGPDTDESGKKIDYYKLTFDAYMNDSSKSFGYEISPASLSGASTNFGATGAEADKAYEYSYEYTVDGSAYSCWQILAVKGEDFFIFTFTAPGKSSDSSSAFSNYLEKARLTAKNFKFTSKSEASAPAATPDYPKDADGYLLISNKTLSGFDLYVPDDYEVIDNSGLVSAKISEYANINVFKATDTGIGALDYMLRRRESIKAIADDGSFKDLELKVAERVDLDSDYFKDWDKKCSVLPEYDGNLKFGNSVAGQVVGYKYSYSHGGNDYVCYMIFGVSPGLISRAGYVFTYTTANGEYDTHWGEIKKILEKIEF